MTIARQTFSPTDFPYHADSHTQLTRTEETQQLTMSNRVHHFKLVLLGDTAVGKSCLVVRFVRDEFFEFQEPTIGGKGFPSR